MSDQGILYLQKTHLKSSPGLNGLKLCSEQFNRIIALIVKFSLIVVGISKVFLLLYLAVMSC